MQAFNVSWDDAKTLYIWLMYGGKFNAWAADTKDYVDVDLWNCSEDSWEIISFIDRF